jgi:hypothetical protein
LQNIYTFVSQYSPYSPPHYPTPPSPQRKYGKGVGSLLFTFVNFTQSRSLKPLLQTHSGQSHQARPDAPKDGFHRPQGEARVLPQVAHTGRAACVAQEDAAQQ